MLPAALMIDNFIILIKVLNYEITYIKINWIKEP